MLRLPVGAVRLSKPLSLIHHVAQEPSYVSRKADWPKTADHQLHRQSILTKKYISATFLTPLSLMYSFSLAFFPIAYDAEGYYIVPVDYMQEKINTQPSRNAWKLSSPENSWTTTTIIIFFKKHQHSHCEYMFI